MFKSRSKAVERNEHGDPVSSAQPNYLEDFDEDNRAPFILTTPELKLLGIAGVGFLIDAYDLFIINQVSVMLQYRLYGGHSLPAGLQGVMKAAANIGAVVGQFSFGYIADAFGRKAVYGKELMIIIFATIMCISAPTNDLSPNNVLVWITIWRIVLGIGVGADYPMSSSVTSDRAKIRKRGTLLAYVFANQGLGSLVGSIVTMIVLLIYKKPIEHKSSKVDGVWRIIVGLSLIPCFGTLYQRLTMPESTRYVNSQKSMSSDSLDDDDQILKEKQIQNGEKHHVANGDENGDSNEHLRDHDHDTTAAQVEEGQGAKAAAAAKKAHFREFLIYFSEWRHLRIILGTTISWFLLDIAFYGINLNQSVVLAQIGFAGSHEPEWQSLFHIATGNLIITALGFVPGYYVTVLTIEYIGRKPIQLMGFIMNGIILSILAAKFHSLSIPAFVVLFALLQFFFNFGANSTTYIYPAEVFPTRVRATAHGMSAACGKAGAIISALVFNTLSEKIGTPKVLWIFVACSFAGVFSTLLLPEVKGRDPDIVDEEERRAALRRR